MLETAYRWRPAALLAVAACEPQNHDEALITDDTAAASDYGETTAAEERTAEYRQPETTTIPAGTELTFIVDETLSADDTDAGHMFDAHLAGAVPATDGTVARGMVVESRESEGADDPAALIVRLETVEFEGEMLTTRDGDATLPAGSTIVVRLDQPLRGN